MADKLTYLQAIKKVLRKSSRPLSTKEIYHALKDQELIDFEKAKTPLKTISSRIGEEIDLNGTASIFVRIRSGVYYLREKLPSVENRVSKPNKNFFLVIEGIDGSGKTEVAYQLAQILNNPPDQEVKLEFEPNDPSCAGYY